MMNESLHDITPNGMLIDVSALSNRKSEEKNIYNSKNNLTQM